MESAQKTIIITGGAGFIGSHVVRLFVNKYPNYRIVNLDALTYAGNLENLLDIEGAPNYVFERADINDADVISDIYRKRIINRGASVMNWGVSYQNASLRAPKGIPGKASSDN